MKQHLKKHFPGFIILFLLFCSCGKKSSGGVVDPPAPVDSTPVSTERILYNGIKLPTAWPPVRSYVADLENGMDPFYLHQKPDTINISVGRQLFVDDFLIAQTSMVRNYHYADYHFSNPVVKPDQNWEKLGSNGSEFAAPFSDGIWYDELENKFKMW